MPAPSSSTPPNLREIARRAGVSHTTVSLALRNHPSISPDTRERLRTLAEEMGYRSNPLVSALMSQLRVRNRKQAPEVVAFLTSGPDPDDWKRHSAPAGFYEGMMRRAPQLDLRVEPFWLGSAGENAAQVCRILAHRGLRGCLLAPFRVPVYTHELNWDQLVCIALGYAFRDRPLHRVMHHHFSGGFTAFENLSRLGYRRIGLMLEEASNMRVNYNWLGGYLAAQRMSGPAGLRPLILREGRPAGAVRRWLREARPDAVIGFGPAEFAALAAGGARVPHDVAFAALDVQQIEREAGKTVAGINQNLPLVGATACDMLAGRLYHNEQGLPAFPVISTIQGYWVEGWTAPQKKAKRSAARIRRPSGSRSTSG